MFTCQVRCLKTMFINMNLSFLEAKFVGMVLLMVWSHRNTTKPVFGEARCNLRKCSAAGGADVDS